MTTATFSLSDGVLGDDNTATARLMANLDPERTRSALEPLPQHRSRPYNRGDHVVGLFLAGFSALQPAAADIMFELSACSPPGISPVGTVSEHYIYVRSNNLSSD
ncbi:MAG: hypothetical protein R3F53_14165 [Gammaproteobacteria bacterium]